jgi:hypothetical protein
MMTPAKLVVTPRNQATPARASKTNTTALALLGATFLALAAVGGAWLTAGGSDALGGIVRSLGGMPEIEAEQRRQAVAFARLDRLVHSVSVDLGAISSRLKLADHHEVTVNDRIALVDTEIAALTAEVRSLRTPRNEPAAASWRAPVDRLDAALIDTHGSIGDLRASLDEHAQSYRKDIDAITSRLDRLEHRAARDLTASIRFAVRKKTVRRKVRPMRAAQLRNEAAVPGPGAVQWPIYTQHAATPQ